MGVILDPSLKFRDDISARVNKANKMMGIIRRSFCHLNVQMFKLLYKALVRPHIEYAAAISSPRYISDVNIIELRRCSAKSHTRVTGNEIAELWRAAEEALAVATNSKIQEAKGRHHIHRSL